MAMSAAVATLGAAVLGGGLCWQCSRARLNAAPATDSSSCTASTSASQLVPSPHPREAGTKQSQHPTLPKRTPPSSSPDRALGAAPAAPGSQPQHKRPLQREGDLPREARRGATSTSAAAAARTAAAASSDRALASSVVSAAISAATARLRLCPADDGKLAVVTLSPSERGVSSATVVRRLDQMGPEAAAVDDIRTGRDSTGGDTRGEANEYSSSDEYCPAVDDGLPASRSPPQSPSNLDSSVRRPDI